MSITEASGGSGIFSGKGVISPAWLQRAKLNVVFEDVQINQDNCLVAGVYL